MKNLKSFLSFIRENSSTGNPTKNKYGDVIYTYQDGVIFDEEAHKILVNLGANLNSISKSLLNFRNTEASKAQKGMVVQVEGNKQKLTLRSGDEPTADFLVDLNGKVVCHLKEPKEFVKQFS